MSPFGALQDPGLADHVQEASLQEEFALVDASTADHPNN